MPEPRTEMESLTARDWLYIAVASHHEDRDEANAVIDAAITEATHRGADWLEAIGEHHAAQMLRYSLEDDIPADADQEIRARAEAATPGPICTQDAARAAGLDVAPTMEELTVMAETIVVAAAGAPTAEADLARAVPLMAREIDRLRAARDAAAAAAAAASSALDPYCCQNCGGEGGGGTVDPDVWIECDTCRGTGLYAADDVRRALEPVERLALAFENSGDPEIGQQIRAAMTVTE